MPTKQFQKSTLNIYNTTAQTLTEGGIAALTGVNEYTGESIQYTEGSNTITLAKPGLYYISANANITTNSVTGTATLNIKANNTDVPSATASTTIGDTAEIYNLSAITIVEVKPCCSCMGGSWTPIKITIQNSGVSTIWNSLNVIVFKLC